MEHDVDGSTWNVVTAKRLFGPTNMFRLEQGISRECPDDARVDPVSPGFTDNETIVAEDLLKRWETDLHPRRVGLE